MILDIVKADKSILKLKPGAKESILRWQCLDIAHFTQDLKDLTNNMVETMFAANGIGLAAPQVGLDLNLFVMRTEKGMRDKTREAHIIINPKLTLGGETYQDIEGCLSIPKLLGRVTRSKQVTFSYVDIEGKPQHSGLSGLQARVFQHEADHLSGVLFVDLADEFYRPVEKEEVEDERPVSVE
jgi:peptide deformylase